MIKNYTKYGPTGILWALYLIVGVVAFLVSNLYFKFDFKDAVIFGVVNLVAVIVVTEGIDFLFKKAKRRQERKAAEQTPEDESVADTDGTVASEAELVNESSKDDVTTEPESADEVPSTEPANEEPADEALPLITGKPGKGFGYLRRLKRPVAESIAEPTESAEVTVDDEAPLLITGAPGSGKNWHLLEYAASLKNAESDDSVAKETTVESSAPVDSQPPVEDAVIEQEPEATTKPRGRRANPEAVIDAPTSSMPIITPDMLTPKVEPIVEPVVEETTVAESVTPVVETLVVEEPEADETYLSADEFLDTTKLTSPRAIVREYQRLGGKDDIYSILMERQK